MAMMPSKVQGDIDKLVECWEGPVWGPYPLGNVEDKVMLKEQSPKETFLK